VTSGAVSLFHAGSSAAEPITSVVFTRSLSANHGLFPFLSSPFFYSYAQLAFTSAHTSPRKFSPVRLSRRCSIALSVY
jgi:hypothetical protein